MEILSEKELVLLSNYMYIEGSTEIGKKLDDVIVDIKTKIELDKNESLLSGGINQKEALDIISQIQNNDKLMNLEAVDSIDGDVRATCFINPSNLEAVVAFRGTGGIPEAWKDNMKGAYLKDTDMQLKSKSFFEGIKDDYNIKDITGHSKGGNLSQYITIVCDNNIDRCVSFDGQGFGQKFHDAYKDRIEKMKDRITSISSFRDPVNGLLKPVAGNVKYIKTDSLSIPNSHKSTLLKEEKLFNKDGSFSDVFIVDKSSIAKFINDKTNNLENIMSPEGYKNFSDTLGNIAGVVMAGNNYKKSELMKELITKGLKKELTRDKLKEDFNSKDLKELENSKTEYKNLKEEINRIEPSYLNDKQNIELISFVDKLEKQYDLIESGQIKNSDLPKITENFKNACNSMKDINKKIETQKRTPLDEKLKQIKSKSKEQNKNKVIDKNKDLNKKQNFEDKTPPK
ncbi:MAG: Mbeg1-like protein [Clostridiales bacterium]